MTSPELAVLGREGEGKIRCQSLSRVALGEVSA